MQFITGGYAKIIGNKKIFYLYLAREYKDKIPKCTEPSDR